MIFDIKELEKQRRQWVEATCANGFDKGIKRLLTDLYPDNAHFIYELLQNAEDPRARKVRFSLSNESIKFEHNGERLFDIKDIESITSIGVSTKRDEPTSIGKFGVGFKAVFAYTNTPEIHSGDFHFCIQDLVIPVSNDIRKEGFDPQETCFIFPFDHSQKKPLQAVDEVKRGLQALGDNTLLFLHHISFIEYILPNGSLRSLERINNENGHIEIHVSHLNGIKTVSHWLRYEKDVAVVDENGETKNCRIAIAYSLQLEDSKKKKSKWEIVPLEQGQVSIYFPAEKETSNLKFHIHAPFASTVARDSVRDCDENHQLRDAIAELVVDSLGDIRDKGMLTMRFLAVLPNHADNLSSFYEPIRLAIVHAFVEDDFTPTRSRTHAPAKNLYRGPAKIAEILNDDDLSLLTSCEAPLWVANPPQQNQREDRFLDSLNIDSWGWYELSDVFSSPSTDDCEAIGTWIAQKNDAWVMRFYALLGEAWDVHGEYINGENLPIVRVENNELNEHMLPQKVFFPPEQGGVLPQNVCFVKSTVCKNKRSKAQTKYALAFLKDIGVRSFDAKAVIALRLKDYGNPPQKVKKNYYQDIISFIDYWKETKDTESFKKHSFLLNDSFDGRDAESWCWSETNELCMDFPFEETNLKRVQEIHEKDVLWAGYKNKLSETKFAEFSKFLKAIGVMYQINVSEAPVWFNPFYYRDLNNRGARETSTSIRSDYSIDNLDSYIKLKSVLASKLIWKALISADPEVSKARYRPNQQYSVREVDSQLVHILKNKEWIPCKSGVFYKAQDMTKDDLRPDFPYDDRNGLLTAIGFGEQAKKRTEAYVALNHGAQKIGFKNAEEAQNMVKFSQKARECGISVDFLFEELEKKEKSKNPSFPSKDVVNPERRKERFSEHLNDAPEKQYEKRKRTVRSTNNTIDPTTWLRNQYTNQDDQMICQICKEEMPFRKRDGLHYFEKREIFSKKYFPKEHEEQYLALCPVCAAKYDEFVKNDESVMAELKEKIVSVEDCEIPITLGKEKTSIRFVETHLYDLKVIVKGLG